MYAIETLCIIYMSVTCRACFCIDYSVLELSFDRAAMKMANIDAVFDFMFSQPRGKDGVSRLCCVMP